MTFSPFMASSAKPSVVASVRCWARKKCADLPPRTRVSTNMMATMTSTTRARGTEYQSMMKRTETMAVNIVSSWGSDWEMSWRSVSTSLV